MVLSIGGNVLTRFPTSHIRTHPQVCVGGPLLPPGLRPCCTLTSENTPTGKNPVTPLVWPSGALEIEYPTFSDTAVVGGWWWEFKNLDLPKTRDP